MEKNIGDVTTYDVDDSICDKGQFDIKFDNNFKIMKQKQDQTDRVKIFTFLYERCKFLNYFLIRDFCFDFTARFFTWDKVQKP